MPAVAKRIQAWKGKLTPGKQYPVDEALALVKEFATAKFPETVDVAVNLGIDATKSDQQVRGSTVLPNGTGKTVRVAVFTGGKNQDVARAAHSRSRSMRASAVSPASFASGFWRAPGTTVSAQWRAASRPKTTRSRRWRR